MSASTTRIGEILQRAAVVDRDTLVLAVQTQAATSQRLCSALYLQEKAEERDLLLALATQKGFPGAALTGSIVDLSVLDLVPRSVAQRYSMLPICRQGGQLHVAMADPDQRDVIDEVQFVTGTQVVPHVALKSIVDAGIVSAYAAHEQGRRDLLRGPASDPAASQGQIATVAPPSPEVPAVIDLAPVEESLPAASLLPESTGESAADGVVLPATEAKARILVVDDEREIRDILQTALQKSGYEVVCAERGLQALQMVKTCQPDLILLDAMLPEVHGFEICQKIKSSKRFSHVPVIMVTAVYRGWRFAHDIKANYGAEDYIEKPFSIADVLRRVEEQLVRSSKLVQFEAPEQQEIENLRSQGRQAHKNGDHEKALENYRLAIELDPFDARLHFMLAMSLQGIGQSYPAIFEFERAVELDPALFPALKNLAVMYERKGFRSKAAEMWERALLHAKEDQKSSIREHLIKLLNA